MLDKQIANLEKKEKLKYLKDHATNMVLMIIWRHKAAIANIVLKNLIWVKIKKVKIL